LDGFNNFAGAIVAHCYINFDHHNTLTGTAWAGARITGGEALTQINPPVKAFEPASLLLLGGGLLALDVMTRRRWRK